MRTIEEITSEMFSPSSPYLIGFMVKELRIDGRYTPDFAREIASNMIDEAEKAGVNRFDDWQRDDILDELEVMVREYMEDFVENNAMPAILGDDTLDAVVNGNYVDERNKSVIFDTVAIDDYFCKKDFIVRLATTPKAGLSLLAKSQGKKFDRIWITGVHVIDCPEAVYEVLEESGHFEFIN